MSRQPVVHAERPPENGPGGHRGADTVARPSAQRGGGRNRARYARFAVAALCAATETRSPAGKGTHATPAREERWRGVAGTGGVPRGSPDLSDPAGRLDAACCSVMSCFVQMCSRSASNLTSATAIKRVSVPAPRAPRFLPPGRKHQKIDVRRTPDPEALGNERRQVQSSQQLVAKLRSPGTLPRNQVEYPERPLPGP